MTDINRIIPQDEYNALIAANSPSSVNPFMTLEDIENTTPVLSVLATPPGSPATGDRYLVTAVATGAWTGQENKIAEWNGAAWIFEVAAAGDFLYVLDSLLTYRFSGAAWVIKSSQALIYAQNATVAALITAINTTDKTSNYNITTSDHTIVCGAGTFTLTLPTAVGIAGKEYVIKKRAGVEGITTVDGAGSETIDGVLTQLLTAGVAIKIKSDGTNWIII